MSITQTVEIPASRHFSIDVPSEVPAGPVMLTFTPIGTLDETVMQTPDIKERVFGCAKGQFRMAEDYDESLEDFENYM